MGPEIFSSPLSLKIKVGPKNLWPFTSKILAHKVGSWASWAHPSMPLCNHCSLKSSDLLLKGHCHGLTCVEFKSAKTHFTATETYKYWSSFDKNYNASLMKLKKLSSIILIPPGAQDSNLKKSA